ncbi:MAG: hypothetical protein M3O86_03390 [Actinomycetota bacterium]|nr:hypothetical protein [Actinomycetota bacterium]
MELATDLAADVLATALPGRAVRTYPAMLSTEADALAWGRAGGPHGAVVVAGYQASPRGRTGLEWRVQAGRGLGFTLLLRPSLSAAREGWPYLAACVGLADLLGDDVEFTWPDGLQHGARRLAAVAVHASLGPGTVDWITVTVLVEDVLPPRAALLADAVTAIERRLDAPADVVLDDYRARCATLGDHVAARLIPMGPSGVVVEGEAVDCKDDGSLVIAMAAGRRVAVPPQHLGVLDTVE